MPIIYKFSLLVYTVISSTPLLGFRFHRTKNYNSLGKKDEAFTYQDGAKAVPAIPIISKSQRIEKFTAHVGLVWSGEV